MHPRVIHHMLERTSGLVGAILIAGLIPAIMVQAGTSHQAVIIAGGVTTEDATWPATDYLAGRAYTTLLARGFAKTDIRYLSLGPAHDVDGDGNAANDITHPNATSSDVSDTFDTWATNVDTLTVVVLGHGRAPRDTQGFQLNATETISAARLDSWLDALQQTYSNLHATVILDYSFSRGSMGSLAYAGPMDRRVVISSTSYNGRTHYISDGQISFTQHFFDGVRKGDNLNTCFTDARDAMDRFQVAGLDDTQDGMSLAEDGKFAKLRFIGSDTGSAVVRPAIGLIIPDQQLNGDTEASFWVAGVTTPEKLDRVWCTIVPPGYSPDFSTAPVTEITTRTLKELPKLGPTEYGATIGGFGINGDYDLQVYARAASGVVSLPAFTTATQQGLVQKILLVATGDPADSKWAEVRNLSKRVFLSLRARQIPPTQIQYLSPIPFEDFDGDAVNDVDQAPSVLAIQTAIQGWASDADQLVVYLIGEVQASGILRVSASDSILAIDLGAWLQTYQAATKPAIVVMDFPSSGDFISALTPYTLALRSLIGSSRSDRSPVLAADVSFSDFFANRMQVGDSISEAASRARTSSLKASGNIFQSVLIDDNGNGIPNEKNVDGLASSGVYIGTPFFPGSSVPQIGIVMPTTVLAPTATSLLLFVDGVSDADGIASVRARVTSPTNVQDAVTIEYPLSQVGMTAKWSALVPGFDANGLYHVTFIAEDTQGNLLLTQPNLVLKSDSNRLFVTDPALPDSREPDNSVGTARLSDLPVLGYQSLDNGLDTDWIKFYAWPGYKYDFGFLNVDGVLDLSIELYQEVSTSFPDMEATIVSLVQTVDESSMEGDEVVGLDFATAGFYYLKISPATGVGFTSGSYVTYSAAQNILQGINVIVLELGAGGALPGASVTIRNPANGQYLASQVVGAGGLVSFPQFAAGSYEITVNPPVPGYAGYFDPVSPVDQPLNPYSDYGNPRRIGIGDFATTQFPGGASYQAAWTGFYYLPVAYITGAVRDTVYGYQRPVDNAFVSLVRTNDGAIFQAWPWATYGEIWWSGALGQFPATTQVLANHTYWLFVQKAHYLPWGFETPNLGVGQIFNAGNVVLVPEDVNGNHIPDPWEIDFFNALVDAEGDTDFDYSTHYDEYVAGTHPMNANSVLHITNSSMTETGMELTWPVENGRDYRVYASTDPASGVWTPETGPFPCFGFVTEMTWTDLVAASSPRKAYLVEVRIRTN